MSKAKTKRKLADNQAGVFVRSLRVSPRKLNLVAQLIRGMHVSEALTQLTFSKKAIAQDVKKGLLSGIANAENNHNLDIDNLYVTESYVGKSIVMKRFHTRARGRGAKILKPYANLYITLTERDQEEIENDKKGKK